MPETWSINKETGRPVNLSNLKTAKQAEREENENREAYARRQAESQALSDAALEQHERQVAAAAEAEQEKAAEREKLLKPWRERAEYLDGLLSLAIKQVNRANGALHKDPLTVDTMLQQIGAEAVVRNINGIISEHEIQRP